MFQENLLVGAQAAVMSKLGQSIDKNTLKISVSTSPPMHSRRNVLCSRTILLKKENFPMQHKKMKI